MNNPEIWKTIPGFMRYEASNTGKLRSKNYKRTGKTIELNPAEDGGYMRTVLLDNNGKYKTIRVHRIILKTFIGNSHWETNHINGDKTDNKLSNLEYCTHSENLIHAFKIGLEKLMRGTDNHFAKLNDNQIKEIREYAKIHGKLKNRKGLSFKYGVTESHLKDIVSRRRNAWSHI